MDQIRELEDKIASLNQHIATIMHRSVEQQEAIVEAEVQALQES